MRIMKRILTFAAALLLALTLSAAPANAARPAPSGAIITLDTTNAPASLPLAAVAADWSKQTDVTVRVGVCTGVNCIHFSAVERVACNTGFGGAGGCAYRLSDASCQVEVTNFTISRGPVFTEYVTKHEAGHCIWSFSGKTAISYHLPSDRALMGAEVSLGVRKATLTSEDRAYTRSIW